MDARPPEPWGDQMLGGPSGQRYLGCRFPADPAYTGAITAHAEKIGALLDAGRSALVPRRLPVS